MTPGVEQAIEGIRCAFPDSKIEVEEEGSGGAYVIIESVDIGEKYVPRSTWIGAHLPAQLPYADVYPLFIDAGIRLTTGAVPSAPITAGHNFRGRAALQVSRRSNHLNPDLQSAATKFLKVIYWMKYKS